MVTQVLGTQTKPIKKARWGAVMTVRDHVVDILDLAAC